MTQLVLNIRLANDELGLDNLWRRWRNAVVQRTDVCSYYLGWWRGTVVERRSLAGELSLSCA